MPLRSHGLVDENKKTFDRMEMIRKSVLSKQFFIFTCTFSLLCYERLFERINKKIERSKHKIKQGQRKAWRIPSPKNLTR
jgi:hypothetical protein